MASGPQKPTFRQVIMSVLAAMFGVQSDKVRQRDFSHGNPFAFIAVGIAMAILLVLIVFFIVKVVLWKNVS